MVVLLGNESLDFSCHSSESGSPSYVAYVFSKVEFLSYDGAGRLTVLSNANKLFFKSCFYCVIFIKYLGTCFSLLCFYFSR